MKNLLTFLIIHIVDHPDEVQVEESTQEGVSQYVIHVHPEDIGKVIGKNGKVIQSIRTLAKVRAIKEQRKIYVQLAEE